MTELNYKLIEDVAKELYIRALKILPPDVRDALNRAYQRETNPTARTIFKQYSKILKWQTSRICLSAKTQVYQFIW